MPADARLRLSRALAARLSEKAGLPLDPNRVDPFVEEIIATLARVYAG